MICISIYTSSLFEPKAKFHYQPAVEKPNPFLTSNPTVKNPYLPRLQKKKRKKKTSMIEKDKFGGISS